MNKKIVEKLVTVLFFSSVAIGCDIAQPTTTQEIALYGQAAVEQSIDEQESSTSDVVNAPALAPAEGVSEEEANATAEASRGGLTPDVANQSRWIVAAPGERGFAWFWIVDEPAGNAIDVYAYPQGGKASAYHYHLQSDDKSVYSWVKGCSIGNANGCWHGDMWAGDRGHQEWDHFNSVARTVIGGFRTAAQHAGLDAAPRSGISHPDSVAGCLGNAIVMATLMATAGISCSTANFPTCPLAAVGAVGQMFVTFDACGAHF